MSRLMRRPRLLALVAALLCVALIGGGSVVLAASVKSGKAITAVKTVTEIAVDYVESGSGGPSPWTDIAGMSTSITVPSDQKALLIITFSATSNCYDQAGTSTYCYVRVLVDGTQALPGQVVFRHAADANGAWGANSMQFVAGPVNAGAHTVKVQGLVNRPVSYMSLYGRTLTVLRSRV